MTHKQQVLAQLPAYKPLSWLVGSHLQSAYAKITPHPKPQYRRELLVDSYGEDLVAYDFVDAEDENAPCVVIFHGLEGSSRSHYAQTLMAAVKAKKWHGVVAHFRSCGGVQSKRSYRGGDTREIAHVLECMAKRYRKIYAVGYSLGGNDLAKYLGEYGERALPAAAASVSAPLDFPAAGEALQHGWSRVIYTPYFMSTLSKKVGVKGSKIHSLADFDNMYTAPIHGFANAQDYYRNAQAKPVLPCVTVPTLLINAKNDPFLPEAYLPQENEVSDCVYLLQPEQGGHCGFVSGEGKGNLQWLPNVLLQFFDLWESETVKAA